MTRYLALSRQLAETLNFDMQWTDPEFIGYKLNERSIDECYTKGDVVVVSYGLNVLAETKTFKTFNPQTKKEKFYTMEAGVEYGHPPFKDQGHVMTEEEFEAFKEQ